MLRRVITVPPSRDGETISITVGEGPKVVDETIDGLFGQMIPNWESWLNLTDSVHRPTYVDVVLRAADEFTRVGNPRFALLMLAHGYSTAELSPQERKEVDGEIIAAMQNGDIWNQGMQDAMPDATKIYSQMLYFVNR